MALIAHHLTYFWLSFELSRRSYDVMGKLPYFNLGLEFGFDLVSPKPPKSGRMGSDAGW